MNKQLKDWESTDLLNESKLGKKLFFEDAEGLKILRSTLKLEKFGFGSGVLNNESTIALSAQA